MDHEKQKKILLKLLKSIIKILDIVAASKQLLNELINEENIHFDLGDLKNNLTQSKSIIATG